MQAELTPIDYETPRLEARALFGLLAGWTCFALLVELAGVVCFAITFIAAQGSSLLAWAIAALSFIFTVWHLFSALKLLMSYSRSRRWMAVEWSFRWLFGLDCSPR